MGYENAGRNFTGGRNLLEPVTVLRSNFSEIGLIYYLRQVMKRIEEYHIIYIQSLCRMKYARKKFIVRYESSIIIQRNYRRYNECQNDKTTLHRLAADKKGFQTASIIIQRWFRGMRALNLAHRTKKTDLEMQKMLHHLHRKPSEFSSPSKNNTNFIMPNSIIFLISVPDEDPEIDKWLKGAVPDKFDKDMNEYLAKPSSKKPLYVQKVISRTKAYISESTDEQSPKIIEVSKPEKEKKKKSNIDHNSHTKSLAQQRAHMMQTLSSQFKEAGDAVYIPDGYVTAKIYLNKKSNLAPAPAKLALLGELRDITVIDEGKFQSID